MFLGVDGGGTATVAVAAASDGEVLGLGRAGSSNYHNVGVIAAAREIERASKIALREAGLARLDIEQACFGLAALNFASDFDAMRPRIASLGLARRTSLVHDSMTALVGGNCGLTGGVVIAGTGTVAAGVGANGRLVRVGGWGSVLDDEGSAYWIGRRALTTIFRALDGREQTTLLTRSICKNLRVKDPEEIHKRVYTQRLTVEQIASMSKVVLEASQRGDRLAKRIVNHAAEHVGSQLAALQRKLKPKNRLIVRTTGGLLEHPSPVKVSLAKFVARNLPSVKLRDPILPPVAGALILAAYAAQRTDVEDLIRNLKLERSKLDI
jgi:N-acetylglucosamine kinase-like BadF-type ATPase